MKKFTILMTLFALTIMTGSAFASHNIFHFPMPQNAHPSDNNTFGWECDVGYTKKYVSSIDWIFNGVKDECKYTGDRGPVKMSNSGICHTPGSTYYSRTYNYRAYHSLSACLNGGGRRPKN